VFLDVFPEQLCSDLSRQIKSAFIELTNLNILIVKFQASTLDQYQHLLINLSCKSASKPLNATCNMLFAANIAVEQDVIAAAIMIALLILYLHASNVHQHSTFNRNRAATLL